jgi:hypothetical protein
MAGLFEITRKIGNSYEVKLSNTIKIYNVFFLDRLQKAAKDPLLGQVNKPSPPIVITTEKEYKVQEVLASKLVQGKLLYQVKWLGYDEDLDWYLASNLKYLPHKLQDFHLQYASEPGPPRKLQEWQKAWEDRLKDYNNLNNDKLMYTSLKTSFF